MIITDITFFAAGHVLGDVKYDLRLTHHRVSLSVEVSDGSWDVCPHSLTLNSTRDLNHGRISGLFDVWRLLLPSKLSVNNMINDLTRLNVFFDLFYLIRTWGMRILQWSRWRYIIDRQIMWLVSFTFDYDLVHADYDFGAFIDGLRPCTPFPLLQLSRPHEPFLLV